MASAAALNQLFKDLCHHSMWKYAILWRFQDENHMLLTCEDSYAVDTMSGVAMEYAQYKEFISNHSWITPFGCESIGQSGSIPGLSIVATVCNMTRFSYLLGEGIVGKAASMARHQWICVGGMSSQLLLEYQEELGLQVAAGIETILLLPVLPLGLVQLGSLDKLAEDLTMVAQLKDLFCAHQYNFDSNSTLELRMEQIESYKALKRPLLEKYSTCLEINTNLTDLKQTQPFMVPDFEALSFDQAMLNEHLSMGSIHLPHPMVQSNDPLTQVGFHEAHGLGTELLDEIRWNAMCSELFQDHSEEQVMLNTSTFNERTLEIDQSPTLCEADKSIPVISQWSSSKTPTMFDASKKDLLQHCADFCDFNKANLKFTDEFDVVINSTTDSRDLDFSAESGLYKVEQNCLLGEHNITWMENQLKVNEGSELVASFKAKAPPETVECVAEEQCIIYKNITEHSAQNTAEELPNVSDDKKLESCEYAKSHCSSSGRCSDSCLTQCKTEDVSNSEDSGFESHKLSLVSDSEGFSSYLTTCPQRSSIHMPQKNEELEKSACGFWRSCLKKSHDSNRRVKNKGTHRPRPRDRQLIQDRIREIRELIPNASKCSIDTLLEQTVKHMMFLKSLPIHADKLKKSAMSKVEEEDSNMQERAQVPENAASLGCEVRGTKSTPFPLVVENLDRPDQMLVEMQCRNHGLFFDIAQAIKRLGLTILKGILESRLEELWAHFIVEIPKGFHRMDIVWPLMQLLQLKF